MYKKITKSDLLKVQKPARYVGGEYGQVIKEKREVKCRFAFCFPDVYDIGMSNLGLKILYNVLNKREDTWCERVFAPWPDFEEVLRKKQVPLYALESKDSIKDFDIVAFTLQYEMSYTNVLNMLDLAGISLLSSDRGEEEPFVFAGGPSACNPYPMSKFVDMFMLGEGEELISTVTEKYIEWKEKKLPKIEYLKSIKDIDGVYIPLIHGRDINVKKAVIKDFDSVEYPTNTVIPSTEVIQNRISLEVFRGCTRGCRFCQAGYIYRPVREKQVSTLIFQAKECIQNSGLNELSLCSLSTIDYSNFNDLANGLIEISKDKKVGLSLPSVRIDAIDVDILKQIQSVRKSSLTFAPEAGSQRLRDVINKNITKEDILRGCRLAFENGWTNIKLYFMIGLPTETYEDLEEIVELANSIVDLYYSMPKSKIKGKCQVTVATSTFVPKPHTPFQWFGQNSLEKIELKQKFLKEKLTNRCVKYNWHHPDISRLEATISRGDEKICDLIYLAYKNGAKFDSWDEWLNMDAWNKAFETLKIDPADYAEKEYDLEYNFCWDNIMHGVSKNFLIREYKKALRAQTTPKCSLKCSSCGVQKISECKFMLKNAKRQGDC